MKLQKKNAFFQNSNNLQRDLEGLLYIMKKEKQDKELKEMNSINTNYTNNPGILGNYGNNTNNPKLYKFKFQQNSSF